VFTEGWGDGPPAATTASPSPSPTAEPDDGEEGTAPGGLVAIGLDDRVERWSVDLPGVSRAGVTVAGDLALVGTNDGTITAVEVATGEVAWTAEVGGYVDAPVAASDAIALVSVRGSREAGTRVVALDLADGTVSWRYEPVTAVATIGPVSVGDDLAYASPADSSVRAFSLEDGEERWVARLNSFVPAQAPVLVEGGVLVADVRAQVYRLDAATGERTWDHAANAPSFRTNLLVVGDTAVLGTVEGDLLAFDLASGDLTGRLDASSAPIHGIAAAGDVLVASRGGEEAGLVAFAHDPEGTPLREVSPTTLNPGGVVLAWAGAAVVVVVLLGLLGRTLRRDVPLPIEDDGVTRGTDEEGPA
jgi:outer membrane protein assembly factor BamB